MARRLMAVLLPAALALPACGETLLERTATGGGIGAATGVIAGVLLPGISWFGGALIGAVGGAVVGAVTSNEVLK